MTATAQRILIAEACGWKYARIIIGALFGVHEKHEGNLGEIPDYPSDLNAMHEAEKVLFASGRYNDYEAGLVKVMGPNFRGGFPFLWHATAPQRAEAFLRTLGKWEEAE